MVRKLLLITVPKQSPIISQQEILLGKLLRNHSRRQCQRGEGQAASSLHCYRNRNAFISVQPFQQEARNNTLGFFVSELHATCTRVSRITLCHLTPETVMVQRLLPSKHRRSSQRSSLCYFAQEPEPLDHRGEVEEIKEIKTRSNHTFHFAKTYTRWYKACAFFREETFSFADRGFRFFPFFLLQAGEMSDPESSVKGALLFQITGENMPKKSSQCCGRKQQGRAQ